MIPFASQRGSGQDLAAHLLNTHDNEYMEVADIQGAIAKDLHGAFAEWEAQAHSLTKCKNYLYSLSINPDDRQGDLTREQYFDYIDRAEERLGLTGQPRAVVFHIKHGREHCHVVWSRVDAFNEKAVHMAFDKDKLMMVTREFARDHGLELPAGYHKGKGEGKSGQLSVYDLSQQRKSGLTKLDHMEAVTEAWRLSDDPKAFVQVLAEKGYMLATGDRPYVLVDFYGGIRSLPRMIDDKNVRAKDVLAFLETDYPKDSLPHVDEAKKMVADYRKIVEKHLKNEQAGSRLDHLKVAQERRRANLENRKDELSTLHEKKALRLKQRHLEERRALRGQYLAKVQAVKQQRQANRATGLAAFLGKVTGVSLVIKKLHNNQDRKLLNEHLVAYQQLKEKQRMEEQQQGQEHGMEQADLERQLRGLKQTERKEVNSLKESLLREVRVLDRGRENAMPSLALELKPRGRRAAPHKAAQRHTSSMARELYKEKQERKGSFEGQFKSAVEDDRQGKLDLGKAFNHAATDGKSGEGKGGDDGPKPKTDNQIRRYGHSRRRSRDNDLNKGR